MATYKWIGGALNSASSWTPQPVDGGNPPPGPLDFADLNGGGQVQGSITVVAASFAGGSFDFFGGIGAINGIQINSGASVTVEAGASLLSSGSVNGILTVGNGATSATLTQLGGSISVSTNEFILALPPTTQFIQQGGTNSVGNYLEVGVAFNGKAGVGKYALSSAGVLTAGNEIVGYGAKGIFEQSGGTNTVAGLLQVGFGLNPLAGNGTYTLGGDANSKLDAQSIMIGSLAGDVGTFFFDTAAGDSAQLQLPAVLGGSADLVVGGLGQGSFTQGGGHLNANLDVGQGSTGQGDFILNGHGSTLSADSEIIGDSGIGTFTQNDGQNIVVHAFDLGEQKGSNGTYNLTGGLLEVQNQDATIGVQGKGSFFQTAGQNTIDQNLIVGLSGNGTYQIGGTINQATLKVSGSLSVAQKKDSVGQLLVQSDGVVSVSGNLYVGGAGTPGYDDGGTAHVTVLEGGRIDLVSSSSFMKLYKDSIVDVSAGAIFVGGQHPNATIAPGVHLWAGGTIFGQGTIKGDVIFDGSALIRPFGGTLDITGNVGTGAGTGATIQVERSWTLEIGGSCSPQIGLWLDGSLVLDSPSKFQGTIEALAPGAIIDLKGVTATAATLSLTSSTNGTISVGSLVYNIKTLFGDLNKVHLAVSPDGTGGTKLIVESNNGRAEHGYLAGATVFIDSNNNGKFDNGEASSITDGSGSFSALAGNGALVVIGGTDDSTGLAFGGALAAPSGSSFITPLTSLIVAVQNAGTSDPFQAEQAVLAGLGLDSSTSLMLIDSIAGTQSGDRASAAVYVKGAEVVDTIQLIASTLTGAGATTAWQDVTAALGTMIHGLSAGQSLDLTSNSTLTALINLAAQAENIDVTQLAGGLASVVSAVNHSFEANLQADQPDGSLLTDTSALELVAEGAASTALGSAGHNPATMASVVSSFTGSALANAVISAVHQLPAASVTSTSAVSDDFSGTVGAGHTVTVTMLLTGGVTVTGAPTMLLNDGASATFDASASTATSLVFDYTVGATDQTSNLAIVSVNQPVGTTVLDAGGHSADFSNAFNIGLGLNVQGQAATVVGTAGNDAFHALGTNSAFDGAGGHDTLSFDGASSEFAITNNGDGSVTITDSVAGRDFGHHIVAVEDLQFTDKNIFVENADNANIARLYSAALDRAPDAVGLFGWEDIYETHISQSVKAQGIYVALAQADLGGGTSVAGGFTHSTEFMNKYGSLDDAGFITLLYNNVLDRAPDAAGLAGWLNAMQQGGLTREWVLVGFAESQENINKTAADWLIQI